MSKNATLLDLRQTPGLIKLNLIQCGTHGKLFSAKNPSAFCSMCGPETLKAVQVAKATMGINNATAPAAKAPKAAKAAPAAPVAAPAPAAAATKTCRAGKHTIPADAKRCLPCKNEGAKARRDAAKK